MDVEFDKWARKAGLSHTAIRKAAVEIESGLIDARLGGFLIKKRVSRENEGKSSGYRTIIAHREGDRMVFLYGFAKNETANITKKERQALAKRGDFYMEQTPGDISKMVSEQLLVEVNL